MIFWLPISTILCLVSGKDLLYLSCSNCEVQQELYLFIHQMPLSGKTLQLGMWMPVASSPQECSLSSPGYTCQKRIDFRIREEKESKKGSFLKYLRQDYQILLRPPWKYVSRKQ